MALQESSLIPRPISVIDGVDLAHVQSTMDKIRRFQAIVQQTLKEGHDYGVIPGTGNKPTLLKPGAEKILMLMGLTSEYEVAERVQDYEKGFFAFTVKCRLSKGGLLVTEGLGHANTKEARYANRWVTERKLPEGVDKNTLQTREREGQYGTYKEYLVENLDTFTLVNTVLKMAKKRAQVDATLTVASLSQIFTQDLEDMVEDGDSSPRQDRRAVGSQHDNPQSGGTRNKKASNGSGAQKALFAAVDEWAKKHGHDPAEVKDFVASLIREHFGVESCAELTVQQWTEAARRREEFLAQIAVLVGGHAGEAQR